MQPTLNGVPFGIDAVPLKNGDLFELAGTAMEFIETSWYLAKYKFRILVSLLPLLFALGHASRFLPWNLALRLDNIIYDARLRLTMPQTFDDRIVIVDIDEKSLSAIGRWPWSRSKLSDITTELFERQKSKRLVLIWCLLNLTIARALQT